LSLAEDRDGTTVTSVEARSTNHPVLGASPEGVVSASPIQNVESGPSQEEIISGEAPPQPVVPIPPPGAIRYR
jgi:hypothetical protein